MVRCLKITYIPYSRKIWQAVNHSPKHIGEFKFGETNACTLHDNATLNIGEVFNLAISHKFAKSPNFPAIRYVV